MTGHRNMKPELLNEDLMALPLSYSTYMPSLCLAGMACDNFFLSQQNTRMWVGDMVILFDQYSFLCLCGFWVSLFISNPQIHSCYGMRICQLQNSKCFLSFFVLTLVLSDGRWVFLLVWIAVTVTSERFINQCLAPAGHELDRLPFL